MDNKITDLDVTIPLQRRWLLPNQQASEQADQQANDRFSVISYNILCDPATPEHHFPYCPREYFKDYQRFPQLMRELDHHDADIVCLQEVTQELYKTHLEPMLCNRGYRGSFCQVSKRGHVVIWGNATFFKKIHFELIEEELFNFSELLDQELADDVDMEDSKVPAPFGRRPFLFSKLQSRNTGKIITICNTHLSSWTKEGMLGQSLTLSSLEASLGIQHLLKFAGGEDKPHIYCGDFNLEPHFPGYQLLQNGCLSEKDQQYLRNLCTNDEKKEQCLLDLLPNSFSHKSKHLKSAYKSIVGHEVPFSNHQDCLGNIMLPSSDTIMDKESQIPSASRAPKLAKLEDGGEVKSHRRLYQTKPEDSEKGIYIGAVDYFWYGSDSLHCCGVLEMIDESKLEQFHSAPNIVFPSDHLLMKTEFHFMP